MTAGRCPQRRADGLVALALHRRPDMTDADGGEEECVDCAAEQAAAAGEADSGAADATTGQAHDTASAGPGVATDATDSTDAADGVGGAVGLMRQRRLDRAVPAFSVGVDLSQVSVNAAGRIQVNAPGVYPGVDGAGGGGVGR